MDADYQIDDTTTIISPALVVFRDLVEENTRKMIEIAGDVRRLRPHCKTHKMKQVVQLQADLDIRKHKCATFAEAEMLASAGITDIFLAYNLVGPNIRRAVQFVEAYPHVELAVTGDHPQPLAELGTAMVAADQSIGVMLDLDTGQHRTGLPAGEQAAALYQQIANTPGLRAAGFHAYDGQNHQADRKERAEAVQACWEPVQALREQLEASGLRVPRIVAGGTGSFPIYAAIDDPSVELSPGTCVFNDTGYQAAFPDLSFRPAALVLTRVISRPTENRVTFDLGYKAIASDPPVGRRLSFPDIPDAKEVLQNEEHLVIETDHANRFSPGDEQLAIPVHACPTSALHKEVWVVSHGKVSDRWPVAARDRWLTI